MLLQFLATERRNRKLRAQAHRQYTDEALKQQRELHAQSLARQQTLFNSMIEGVLLTDTEGRVLLVNESLRQLLSFRADLRGSTLEKAFGLPGLSALAQRLKTEKNISDAELEVPGESPRSLQINAAVIIDNGREQGEIFVFHDVTRLKQLENIRKEFVANVSHELRTPLSLIRGFSETLLDGAKDNSELNTRFLQKIDKQSHRLLFLIEDLLSISQLESGQIALELQPIQLRELAQRVLDDLAAPAADRQVTLQNAISESISVKADASRLQQVFFNLAENAIKYGKLGGNVRVEARQSAPGRIEISVTDDGPGIPVASQPRIFERFYRVDRARSRETGGTGLGLSIVKHIVQAHGGEVWVRSEPGHGAAFFFTLPLAKS